MICRYCQCELSYQQSTSSLKYHLLAKHTANAATPSHQRQTLLSSLQQRHQASLFNISISFSSCLLTVVLPDKIKQLTGHIYCKQDSSSQLGDGTILILKDSSQIPSAITLWESFSKASGLCLNLKNCKLLAIKELMLIRFEIFPPKTNSERNESEM